jgi:hypothetical protein
MQVRDPTARVREQRSETSTRRSEVVIRGQLLQKRSSDANIVVFSAAMLEYSARYKVMSKEVLTSDF